METWKKVIGFENEYEVSSLGNIRSLERLVNHYKGGMRLYKSNEKKIRLNRSGYFRCNLKKDNKRYDYTVHRLVAEAFLGKQEGKNTVNHINGIKTDNRIENLEWVTLSENTIHAVKTRLIKTKLTDIEAMQILNSTSSHRKLAAIYGVSSSIVWRIKNGLAYKHLKNT